MLCELPFMLNLPSGTYQCMADGKPMEFEVLQEYVAIHLAERQCALGTEETLRSTFGNQLAEHHIQSLRTVLLHRSRYEVEQSELIEPSDNQLFEQMQSRIIIESRSHIDKEALAKEAETRLKELSPEDRQHFRQGVAKKLHPRQMPDKETFIAGVNALVRLYMQRFNDFFVEEVAVHQLASQSPLNGIAVQLRCDGELVDHYAIAELVPPLMRRPWLRHPQAAIETFKADLSQGIEPNPISLLGIRARAFLQRGANRSAIIEASAALDLALSTKIREGFEKQGWVGHDIDELLRQPRNQRFADRAKALLKESTGKSAAHFDNVLWQRVSKHRKIHRQEVAHADREPSRSESEQVVRDFLDLGQRISGIVPDIDIQCRAFLKWKAKGEQHGNDLEHWLEAEQELIAERDS